MIDSAVIASAATQSSLRRRARCVPGLLRCVRNDGGAPGRLGAILLALLLLLGAVSAAAAGEGGLAIGEARPALLDGRPALAVEIFSQDPLRAPELRVASDPPLTLGAAQVSLDAGRRSGIVLLPVETQGADLVGRKLDVTLADGTRQTRATATVATGYGEPDRWQKLSTALGMLGLAFLGGLILNLMPCVLPVLSLKIFAVARHGGQAPARIRAGFLATAAGILASFAILALFLIVLRRAGGLIGWGIQFQQPGFIAAMAVVTTLFACNLWGVFEVPLPGRLANALGQPGREGLARDFTTGLFATLLATPCSAPFVGTAVGFALSRDGTVIFAIFLTLGLGLAAPYLVLAALPRLAAMVPKPGPWMPWLRRVLALALAGTAAWLLTILVAQVGPTVAMLAAALMLTLVVLLGFREKLGRAAPAAIVGLALAAVALPVTADTRRDAPRHEGGPVAWVPFEYGALRALIAEGRTVFLDVGAEWCPTCRLNERLVIERAPVAERLSGLIVPMKADWTNPDPGIALFMASYGRYAIPFTIVYGPGAPKGIVLPELLTSGTVLDALERAGHLPATAQTQAR